MLYIAPTTQSTSACWYLIVHLGTFPLLISAGRANSFPPPQQTVLTLNLFATFMTKWEITRTSGITITFLLPWTSFSLFVECSCFKIFWRTLANILVKRLPQSVYLAQVAAADIVITSVEQCRLDSRESSASFCRLGHIGTKGRQWLRSVCWYTQHKLFPPHAKDKSINWILPSFMYSVVNSRSWAGA